MWGRFSALVIQCPYQGWQPACSPQRYVRPAEYVVLAVIAFLLPQNALCVDAATKPTPSTPNQQDPLNRETPESSVFRFLEACHARNYAQAWRYLDLRGLPEDKRTQEGPQLAQQLEQVLDRDPRFDVASLSRQAEGDVNDGLAGDREIVDTFTVDGKQQQLLLERARLRSGLQVWLFAPESIGLIPKLALLFSSSPVDKYLPPQLVNYKPMDTPLWRWIAMVLLAVVLGAVSRWISRAALFVAGAFVKFKPLHFDRKVLDSFAGPFQLLLPAAIFRAALPVLGLSALLRLGLQRLCELLLIAGFAWLFIRMVDASIGGLRSVLTARKSSFPYASMSLASRILKLTILVFAFTALLSDWGYNTSTILAGLGVGGIAIALAAQKTIENLFGGVSVISDRPVRVGDYCKFGDRSGTVEDIGLRSTRVRTIDRTLVSVPNGAFAAMTLENFNQRDKMLFHITLNLRRDTTPEQVRAVLESVGKTLTTHSKIEAGAVPIRFVGIGSYSLDLEVFVYVLTMDGDEFLKIQQELLLTILDEIAAAGTALALPTQASVDYSVPRGDALKGDESVLNGKR
jgi:MscS family membrane protein